MEYKWMSFKEWKALKEWFYPSPKKEKDVMKGKGLLAQILEKEAKEGPTYYNPDSAKDIEEFVIELQRQNNGK